MKVGLFSFVGVYSQGLSTLANILTKGAEYAAATGATETDLLEWKLAEDMFPLRRQAQIVCDFSTRWPARAAGLALPQSLDGESTLSELQAAIVGAQAWLSNLRPEQFEGQDDVPLSVDIGQLKPTLPIGQWVSGFATGNFYFHLSMAYAILRTKGVPLGKRDFFAGGL